MNNVHNPLSDNTSTTAEVLGLCALHGYDENINKIFSMCNDIRNDYHMLLTITTVTSTRFRYHIQYACLSGNLVWFIKLFWMTKKDKLAELQTPRKESLYHLVCTIPDTTTSTPENIKHRLEIFQMLLKENIPLSLSDENEAGETILHLIIRYGLYDIFDLLMTKYKHLFRRSRTYFIYDDDLPLANTNATTPTTATTTTTIPTIKMSNTLMHYCCMYPSEHSVEMLQVIWKLDNTIWVKNDLGDTPLHSAIKSNNCSVIRELYTLSSNFKGFKSITNKLGDSYLHLAAQYVTDIEIFRLLQNIQDINLDMKNNNGYVPMDFAIEKNNTELVNELLSYYLDKLLITITSTSSNTTTNVPSKRVSLKAFTNNSIVHMVCAADRPELIEPIIQRYVDYCNTENKKNFTPLSLAAYYGKLRILDELLKYPDIFILQNRTYNGFNALHYACLGNQPEAVQILCSMNIPMNIVNNQYDTPLLLAAKHGNTKAIKALLKYEGKLLLDLKNKDGNTALHSAIQNKHMETVKILCTSQTINMNIKNLTGNTPLHVAVNEGNIPIIEELLKYRSRFDCNSQNKEGDTILHLSTRKNDLNVVKLLCSNLPDLDTTICNNENKDPYELAKELEYYPIMDILISKRYPDDDSDDDI